VGRRAYGAPYGGYGQLSAEDLEQARQAKSSRERSEWETTQARYERQGGPPEPSAMAWQRLENRLFKSAHVEVGINFSKYDNITVDTEGGQGTEEVIQSFQEACDMFGLKEELVANIQRCGYDQPTPVQKYAIPAVMGGSDVLVTAQTGSGKTAAFLVPIIEAALKAGRKPFEKGPARPTSIVLAPTRELCQQIAFEAQRLSFKSFCRVVEVYGGANSYTQLGALAKGCEIIVATPGRFKDFMQRDFISVEEVKFLALDEADRMLDMGFEPEIRTIVDEYGMPEPSMGEEEGGRQTMMFSATFPTDIQNMAFDYLHPAYFMIKVGRVGSTTSNVEQRFEDVSSQWDRFDMLVQTMDKVTDDEGNMAKTLIFCNTKRLVDEISNRLQGQSVEARALHGDVAQRDRNQALSDLKSGNVDVLVATDVAARGLDLPGIGHVINFELPKSDDDYVHRIGRTGRIGNKGVATSFVGKDEPALKGIVKSMQMSLKEDPESASPVPSWLQQKAY